MRLRTYIKRLSPNFTEFPYLNRNRFNPGETVVVLDVEDNGCGIPEDKMNRVFDPFFTTKRHKGGMGLGLAVSHNIMDIHGADILIENRKEGGTKATLVFKA